MARQKSQPTSHQRPSAVDHCPRTGTLYIVGTPIGSPDDLTIRAGTVLRQVSIVAAETPRATQTLLTHHGISTRITSYGPGQYDEKITVLLHHLREGHDVALVSDSGMPVVYDPGQLLIAAAQAAGCPVTVIPGPSALTAAVALSGYSGDRLLFHGRLPGTPRLLDKFFTTLKHESVTTVMFASPRSLASILRSLDRILPERQVTIAVNMTKKDEGLYQGRPRQLVGQVQSLSRESEVTVVLAGMQKNKTIKRSRKLDVTGRLGDG